MTSRPTRQNRNAAIAAAEAELAELDARRDALHRHLETLQKTSGSGELHIGSAPAQSGAGSTSSLDAPAKVALFRSLFRGRADVFPRLWTNTRTGKKGCAPACGNEWVRGVCDKPRVRCAECPHQAFPPVTDEVILGHLQGRHVIGCYPLLRDETCWFLAVDIDKAAWRDDVSAFLETSESLGVPVSVERSRSGNGAHAWLFFAAPVPVHWLHTCASARSVARWRGISSFTGREETLRGSNRRSSGMTGE